MSLVFTEYVRAMVPGGPPPDAELFSVVWSTLRGAMVAELKKRSLWSAPPACLGIPERPKWTEDAVDEIVHDCYAFIFVDRLPSLRAQLKVKDNVEGLVFLSLKNYLYDTQKKYDPLGFRTFEVLRNAIRQAVGEGRLHVLRGDHKVRNSTVLGFAPDADDTALGDDFAESVRKWNDDLLPEMVTARGRRVDEVASRLANHLSHLPDAGIEAFRFKDLVDPLKKDVRVRWRSFWSLEEGETALEDADDDLTVVVRKIRPDSAVEDRDAFAKLLSCMAEALASCEEKTRTREYLGRLWVFLRNHASEAQEDKVPSQRKIAGALGIPRERLAGLQVTLGQWVEDCQADFSQNQPFGKSRR